MNVLSSERVMMVRGSSDENTARNISPECPTSVVSSTQLYIIIILSIDGDNGSVLGDNLLTFSVG